MAKGKKAKSNSYTSKGQRSNVSKIGKRKLHMKAIHLGF